MIQLTRLNRRPLWVNPELLKFVENTPDSVITLTTGEKIVVLEAVEVIVERLIEFRRRVLDGMLFCGLTSPQGIAHLQKTQPATHDQSPCPDQHEERG